MGLPGAGAFLVGFLARLPEAPAAGAEGGWCSPGRQPGSFAQDLPGSSAPPGGGRGWAGRWGEHTLTDLGRSDLGCGF